MKDIDFDNLLNDLGVPVIPDDSSDEEELLVEGGVKQEGAEVEEVAESHFVHEEDAEEARALSKKREAELERERERERELERQRREREAARERKLKEKEARKEEERQRIKEKKTKESEKGRTKKKERDSLSGIPLVDITRGTTFSNTPTLEELRRAAQHFAFERDWDQRHTPRNLCLALMGEVGEVAECFQCKSDEEAQVGLPGWSESEREHLAEEMSDVLLSLLRLADKCAIDLPKAALEKLKKNEASYPSPLVQGTYK